MKQYKKYTKLFSFTFVFLLAVVVCLNYFINPYNIFKQRFLVQSLLKPEAKIQERLTKPIGLKIDKRKIDAVFMGSSRVDLGINKNDYKLLTGKEAEVIAIGGLQYNEIEEMTDIALKIHPEINNIYIGADFQTFTKDYENINDNRVLITKNPKLEMSEICSSLLSVSTTGNSFWTIIKNVIGVERRMFYSDGYKHIFVNPDIQDDFNATIYEYTTTYNNFELSEEKINEFSNYVKELKKQGKNVKIFIMPTHITLQNLIDKTGKRNQYNQWQRKLAEIDDILDFNYENKYTTEEINPEMQYFFDGSHSTHKFGKLIIEDLLNKKPKTARILTKRIIAKDEK